MAYLAIILFIIVLLIFVPSPMRARRRIPTISNPILGVLNLIGPPTEAEVKADLEELTQYFSEVRQEYDVPPLCDVLLLYCNINSGGVVIGSAQSFEEIVREAGAAVTIVATNNAPEEYQALGKQETSYVYGTNLMMTIDRRGSLLARFLAQLFAQMKSGVSMPMALHNLAPQVPTSEHNDGPAIMCALGYGQIAFR